MNKKAWVLLGAVAAVALVVVLIVRFVGNGEEEEGTIGDPQSIETAGSGEMSEDEIAAERHPEGTTPWNPDSAPISEMPQDQRDQVFAAAEEFAGLWLSSSYEAAASLDRAQALSDLATEEFAQELKESGQSGGEWSEKMADRQLVTTAEVDRVFASEYIPSEDWVEMGAEVSTETTSSEEIYNDSSSHTLMMTMSPEGGTWKVRSVDIVNAPPEGVGD